MSRSRALFVSMTLACLALPGRAEDIKHASAEDCAVYGAVYAGKALEMFSNAYGADCDLAAMGMTVKVEPRPGQYYEGVKTSLSPVQYQANGQRAVFT